MVLAGCPRCRGDLRYAADAGEFRCLTCGHRLYVCPTCRAGIRVQHGEGMACSLACGWTLQYQAVAEEPTYRGQTTVRLSLDPDRRRERVSASLKRCANCSLAVGEPVSHPLTDFSRVRRSDVVGESYRYLPSCRASRAEVELRRRATRSENAANSQAASV